MFNIRKGVIIYFTLLFTYYYLTVPYIYQFFIEQLNIINSGYKIMIFIGSIYCSLAIPTIFFIIWLIIHNYVYEKKMYANG